MYYIKSGTHKITITHEDHVLFPKHKITKKELITYYHKIAPLMLPYMKHRPLTMHRFPKGITEEGFYQKNASDYFPTWIKTKSISKKEGGDVHYVVCNNTATLLYIANQLCITPHIWLSKIDKLNIPDKMIFDLDPSTKNFALIITAAKHLKKILESLGLKTFIMTTGSRGVHIVIPLKREASFDIVRTFAKSVAELLIQQHPTLYTLEIRKQKRGKKIFIDTLRNAFAQTGVAPYAVRAKEGAPIATPISWSEVKNTLRPDMFTIKNIFRRLSRKKDPWANMTKSACSLKIAQKKLNQLIEKINP